MSSCPPIRQHGLVDWKNHAAFVYRLDRQDHMLHNLAHDVHVYQLDFGQQIS